MTTANDILLQALKMAGVLGIGQSANAEDINDSFHIMQGMLAQWQRKRWLVWNLTTVSKVSTGAQSYTVGAGQNYNITRPDKIESAFIRQLNNGTSNQVDYVLDIIESREDYNRIILKNLVSLPFCIFYDSAYPYGRIYPWPVPTASIYEIHITVKTQFDSLTSLSQTINMPPEYIAAIEWNLAQRLRVAYRFPADQGLNDMAKDSLNLIRNANAQISTLTMPRDLYNNGGLYNIFSDYSN